MGCGGQLVSKACLVGVGEESTCDHYLTRFFFFFIYLVINCYIYFAISHLSIAIFSSPSGMFYFCEIIKKRVVDEGLAANRKCNGKCIALCIFIFHGRKFAAHGFDILVAIN